MSSGVFWLIDDEILAIPYNEGAFVGIAKSGNNYNHRLLWEFVKPKHCNKPFDYYPRGRVEINDRGECIIYMSPHVGEEYIPIIKKAFGFEAVKRISYDGSQHYRCFLDD